jgi:hypothetical protein
MKKIVVFLLVVLALATIASAAIPTSVDIPVIKTTFQSQSPDPVEPGQIVTVKFKIENNGSEAREDSIVRILPKFPFSLYGDAPTINIGKLRAATTGRDAVVVEFKLKLDELATEGDSELELEVQTGSKIARYTNNEFLIDVQTHDAILDITSITYEPEHIPPGQTAKLKIFVKNDADSLLKDIKFNLDFNDDVPLAPFQSSSQRRIDNLQSGHQLPLAFNIIADPAASPGLYKVPLNITYFDEKGNSYAINDVLAIKVGEIPKIRAYVKKSTVQSSKSAGIMTIGIANAGTTDVKFMELTVLPSEDFELFSTSNYVYIGDVDSDDTESEELNMYIKTRENMLTIPLQFDYYDANNNPYSKNVELELELYSSSQLKRFGIVESSSSGIIFLIVVFIIACVVLRRKYKKDPVKYAWVARIMWFLKKNKKK